MVIGKIVLRHKIRGFSSVPKNENWMGCSCGMEESEYYSFSTKRFIEEPVSIKTEIILLSGLLDTR